MSIDIESPYEISNRLVKGCRQILKASQINEKKKVTIFTSRDYPQQHIVNSYYQASLDLGAETTIVINEQFKHPMLFGPDAIKVPKATEAAIWASDMSIFMGMDLFRSPIIEKMKKNNKAGFFGYNSFRSTEKLIINYPPPNESVVKRADAAPKIIKKGSEVRFTTSSGTNLTMVMKSNASGEIGFLQPNKGHIWDILGGSGIYGRLEPDSFNGTYIIAPGDYPSELVHRNGFPYAGDKIIFKIKDNRIIKIEGGISAKLQKEWFDHWGHPNSYLLAHFTIGTHPDMRRDFMRYLNYEIAGWDGEWIEGLIGFGVGIAPPSHTDFMNRNGSVYVDGEQILDNEKFVGPLSDEALGIKHKK